MKSIHVTICSLIVLVSLLMMSGCTALSLMGTNYYVGKFDFSLSSVERPSDAKVRYGEQVIDKYNPKDSSKFNYIFEDGLVKILWLPAQEGFYFQVLNKTDNSIKIIWDEAAYVDQFNKTHRIMHNGVKFIERNNPQPPTVIIRKGSIDEFVSPTDNVYFHRSMGSQYVFDASEWRYIPLINIRNKENGKIDNSVQSVVGKKIQVLLPLEIQGTANDYIFEFTVTNGRIVQENQLD